MHKVALHHQQSAISSYVDRSYELSLHKHLNFAPFFCAVVKHEKYFFVTLFLLFMCCNLSSAHLEIEKKKIKKLVNARLSVLRDMCEGFYAIIGRRRVDSLWLAVINTSSNDFGDV